jgi:septal ring factor EnvC (AmiA/AmiB activator)
METLERQKSRDEAFQEALHAFESASAIPIVEGEMEGWITEVKASFEHLESLLLERTRCVHSDEFAQILRQDPALQPRIEEMHAENDALLEQGARLRERIEALKPAVRRVEPDEKKIEDVVSQFVEDALAFVVRVRKQESAVRTWLVEAYTRDRGVGD